MLHLVNSNHPEPLLDALVRRLTSEAPGDAFAASQVLVPSIAMRTFVQNGMAEASGICANVQFSFLAQWLWSQVARLLPVGERSPLAVEALVWRIHTAFSDPEFVSEHPRLAAWLEQADPAMQFDLAQRVAALFDKYMTYRPQWIAAWMQGELVDLGAANAPGQETAQQAGDAMQDQHWQRDLWQRIAREMHLTGHHPFVDFLAALRSRDRSGVLALGMPASVHVFGLPSIPPIYLEMLDRLSVCIDVHLYLLNPCREYWFDIVDPKRLSYLASRGKAEHLEVGNRLLAMWGKQTRGFLEQLLARSVPASDEAAFVDMLQPGLLGCVQAAVLDMQEIDPGSAASLADDGSICFHSCHTLVRELEVLHDQLLACFNDAEASLSPSQVLVVVPDLEQAAPLIDAVFGSATGLRHVPYRITGRPASSANPVAAALLKLLSLAGTRHYASQVFGLLQDPLVGERFGLHQADLDHVLEWLPLTQTHWGLDREQRIRHGATEDGRHSFEQGLARLYLGYALPTQVQTPFAGLLAPCNVEGDSARVLVALDFFLGRLRRLESRLSVPQEPGAWQALLLQALDEFVLARGERLADLAATRSAIIALCASMQEGGAQALPMPVVRAALKEALGEPTRGGSPTGSVTFSAFSSLRNIPYDMICMVGMNDGAFPGQNRAAEFDLMRHQRQMGDRDRREEDRNLFLDLLLAARRRLHVSYTGRNVRDNSPLPPSVLVSDLLDYLAQATAAEPDNAASRAAARSALIVEHPLQPFSEAYFDGQDSRLFSYQREYCDALRQRRAQLAASLGQSVAQHPQQTAARDNSADQSAEAVEDDAPQEPQPAFFEQALSPAPEAMRRVSLEQLVEFFRNPSRYLLRRRMRLALPEDAVQIADEEAFMPDGLARFALAGRLLPHLLAGAAPAEIASLARAGQEYPDGPIGDLLLQEELQSLQQYAQRLQPRLQGAMLPPLSASLGWTIDNEQWMLEGALADVRESGLVRYRYGNAGGPDFLNAWIHHLFLNCCDTPVRSTEWVASDQRLILSPVPDARERLGELLALYRQGLSRPLHFFPRSAWALVEKDAGAAYKAWSSGMFPGEGDDFSYQLALRGSDDVLDDDFEQTAREVFEPMLEFLTRVDE